MAPASDWEGSVQVVQRMLEEHRHAEAALFLFHLNKYHPDGWAYTKAKLIELASQSSLPTVATILDCSSREELSSCDPLIPGLCQFSRRAPIDLSTNST